MKEESGNLGRTPTPIRKAEVVEEPKAEEVVKEQEEYRFVLTFNTKAELIDVASPQGMSLERAASHIAFAAFWLTDENAKRHEGTKK